MATVFDRGRQRAYEIVERAQALARRATAAEATGTLPIDASGDELEERWSQPEVRAQVLDGIPGDPSVSSIDCRPGRAGWGTTVTMRVLFGKPVPAAIARPLADKAVRRFKSLIEAKEVPTTSRNPSARPDAGSPAPGGSPA